MNENILKYKVQKKKLNSNKAKDVAFQDMVVLSKGRVQKKKNIGIF